ncbi:MAG: hypothetical protein ABFR53_05240 [Actinomycetota bacterium]
MTDKPTDPEIHDTDADLEKLEAADPADAPEVAEDLADRLTRELDATPGSGPSVPEVPS